MPISAALGSSALLPKTSGIYKISIGSNKFYYGSAVNLRKRRLDHINDLKNGIHKNNIMQKAWHKYAELLFEVIELCEKEALLGREQFYLDKWFNDCNNINLCPTAGNTLGYKHTPETIAKLVGRVVSEETREKFRKYKHAPETRRLMSEKAKNRKVSELTLHRLKTMNIGRTRSEETKRKIGEGNKGKVVSVETRQKISDKAKGRQVSEETRAKMSAARKGRKHSPETIAKISEANRRRARKMKEASNAN